MIEESSETIEERAEAIKFRAEWLKRKQKQNKTEKNDGWESSTMEENIEPMEERVEQ